MAKKNKYYVVWQGHSPGIYDSWAACQAQVKGYPDAKYKGYSSLEEAEDAFAGGYETARKTSSRTPAGKRDLSAVRWNSISVDAACSGNPGIMEYRGVETRSGVEIFRSGPFKRGTNNIGEFLALVHALALLDKRADHSTPIYSDSRIAMGWIKNGRARTKLQQTHENRELFALIRRAEQWLSTHQIRNPVLKWNTADWGEIPADFGRK